MHALLTLALLVSLAITARHSHAAAPFTDRLLRDEALWGDGRAEISLYEGTERRYAIARQTEVRHLLVREHFSAHAQVKADDWQVPGAYPVIKLNQIITVPTGTYRYDQGHSSFWRADTGRLIKFALTSNDSCGLTYKQGNFDGTRWRYRAFTYWEGMEEMLTRSVPPADALFYDELPFKLRLLDWSQATEFTSPLMPSVVGSRADVVAWSPATFTVTAEADTHLVTVTHARGQDRFVFDAAPPHLLRRWERYDDTSLTLRNSVRLPYWQLNKPGDEGLLLPAATP